MAAIEAANQHLKELDGLRRDQDIIIRKINKIHDKLSQTPPEIAERYTEKLWIKLRAFYVDAKSLAEKEESVSTQCMMQLDTLIAPAQPAPYRRKPAVDIPEQKRKRMKADTESSRLNSPAVLPRMPFDYSSISVEDQVAAKVNSMDADKDLWIVVRVIRFDRDTNKYEVIDEEPGDEEESGQRKYKLPPSCIIPFPKRTDPSTALDFGTGSQVLAVYPGTTTLYRATAVGPHRKKKSDDYVLEFDDDEEDGVAGLPKRPVPFYHVVQLPEGHRQ